MSGAFKVGEVVVGQHYILNVECNGMECEITEGLNLREWVSDDGSEGTSLTYRVRWATGDETAELPFNLRRKQPPKRDIDTVVSWDICAWRPVGVPA